MRLDRLHIQNFRCYEDATFDFQPGFNLVVGVNGSGKTSLLQAVAASYIDFVAATGKSEVHLPDEDIRFVVDKYEGRSRFERRFPVVLAAHGQVFDCSSWSMLRERHDVPFLSDILLDAEVTEKISNIDKGKSIDLPVLAFYRSNRRWRGAGVSSEFAASQRLSRLDGYNNWSDASANLRDFESWVIGKTLERMQWLLEAGSPLTGRETELTWINSMISLAVPGATGIRYDLRLQNMMVEFDEARSFPFSDLSDGQRGMIALFTDIARRMCILNPHMGKDVLKNTAGVVIIDELDIHLHPAWQRSIVPALRQAFPKVQFIAASHSPQIIGSLKPQEVILLNNGDPSHPRVTYGLDSSSVLEEVMGVNQREPEIESLLSELFSTLEDNDLKKAKSQLAALKKKAPDLPEFAGAEALIRRKEILGK
ncbi:AAA family ATPase [Pseudomonas sp. TNT2022 ID642]|jgi:predicted ATP-binding protein involved in virulence|uniref:AAA family ATPase n=1 Tax=Pseudomonas sp. TNT2022 ID642 TaxID=2942632 RepID=UPI0023620F41|nr:AAA family ATPase [Pseudomonas sp. TNT2022 ID642]MDD1004736.1 AAA family ATPase [Pseudomonas sp. TNT2022 ID642]